jgi:hypothetical protein
VTPQRMLGLTMLPPVSLPMEKPIRPAAVAAPGPALDPDATPPESSNKPEAKSDSPAKDGAAEKKSDCVPGAADDEEPANKGDAATPAPPKKPGVKPEIKEDLSPAAGSTKPIEKPDATEAGNGKKEEGEKADATPAEEEEKPVIDPLKGGRKNSFQPPQTRIKYKPLDDNLRDQIRDSVINDRRKKLLQEQTAKAVKILQDVGLKFATSASIKLTDPDPVQLKEIDRKSEEELRKVADSLGMRFAKTDLVTARELREIDGLGKAFEPFSNESLRNEPTTIIEQAFGSEALCRVFLSEGPDGTTYICWKVQDVPVHIPALGYPGIRDQVVKAWKHIEALPLARKRAKELAEQAHGADKEFAEALAGQTVTGDSKGPAVLVSGPSPEFSFYEDSAAPNPMRRQAAEVRLGNPIIVNNAGRKFMQVVFEKLGEGEVGPALNDDASVYYVVKVVSRREASREAFKGAPLFDRAAPYSQVARIERQIAASEYTSRMGETYAVKWNDAATRDMGPMNDDE